MIRFEVYAYDHAARLIGRRPWDVSRSAQLLFEAHMAAIDRYHLDECIVGIDIYNVQAEALGCPVTEPDGNGSPTITQPVCSSNADILKLTLDSGINGRFPWILETAVRLRESRPRCTLRVPICGPFTLAGFLTGLDTLLCNALLDEEGTRRSLMHLAENVLQDVRVASERGFQVAVFESAASPPLMSPELFRTRLAPALRHLLDEAARLTGARPQLILGGNTLPIVDHILTLCPSSIICPVETDQPSFLAKVRAARLRVKVRINMRPDVFSDASPGRALVEARRVLELASVTEDSSVGTILPFDASPDVVRSVSEFVAESQKNPSQNGP